jgi:hypothetical protein
MSFSPPSFNVRGDWNRTYPITTFPLSEIHLDAVPIPCWLTISHVLDSSPRLETFSISWRYVDTDTQDSEDSGSEGDSEADAAVLQSERTTYLSAMRTIAERLSELPRLKSLTWTEDRSHGSQARLDLSLPCLASTTLTGLSILFTEQHTRAGQIEVSQL